jgi:hypothetical protein
MNTYECVVVVEEVLREGEVTSLNPTDQVTSRLCVKNGVTCWWGPSLKKIFLFILSFFSAGPKTSVLAGA